jgi:hypothetical protein
MDMNASMDMNESMDMNASFPQSPTAWLQDLQDQPTSKFLRHMPLIKTASSSVPTNA